ncbi:MAG: hypothetical protein KC535_00955 [Nanoarchaeota archaeon]|nr:hypothetical protein [Nanoarchaeota archaeon]
MDVVNYKDLQAERDLIRCGLSEDSINAIRATTVVNHNGAQHVVPNSQAGLFEQQEQKDQSSIHIEDATGKISQDVIVAFQQQLQEQQRMFSRFKQFSDQRITSLERDLAKAQETIKEMSNKLTTMASNQQARVNQQASNHIQPVAQQQTQSRPPSSTPVDRNGVAPESVQIDKIFYCGER